MPTQDDVDYLRIAATGIAIREGVAGGRSLDGATSDDLWLAAESVAKFISPPSPVTVSDTWELMQFLANVSDKWNVPENESVATIAYDHLERVIYELTTILNEVLPDSALELQKWRDLRSLNHAIRRRIYLDRDKPAIYRWLSNIRVAVGTTIASVLYRGGKLLSSAGKKANSDGAFRGEN